MYHPLQWPSRRGVCLGEGEGCLAGWCLPRGMSAQEACVCPGGGGGGGGNITFPQLLLRGKKSQKALNQ